VTTPNLPEKLSAAEALEERLDQLPALDTTEVVERTLNRILNGGTAEAIFANPESVGLRDRSGSVIILNAVAGCLPSKMKSGLSRYVVLDCTDPETGESFAATTGSLYAVAAALRAAAAGLLPQRLRVVELESASNPGQTSVWLVKA
jgi:hypothetical protein